MAQNCFGRLLFAVVFGGAICICSSLLLSPKFVSCSWLIVRVVISLALTVVPTRTTRILRTSRWGVTASGDD